MRDAASRALQARKGEQAQGTIRCGHNQDGLGRQLPMLWVWMVHLLRARQDNAQTCIISSPHSRVPPVTEYPFACHRRDTRQAQGQAPRRQQNMPSKRGLVDTPVTKLSV